MLKRNNYWFIHTFLNNPKATFIHMDMNAMRHYIATNRAAKRFLASNKVLNLAKKHEIQIDLTEGILLRI